jgi:sugar phosphate isomerase/epimerase
MDGSGDRGRRTVLRGLCAAAVAAACAPAWQARDAVAASAADGTRFFAAPGRAIGVQLYTLGQAIRDDLDGSFGRLAAMGCRELELAGLHGHDAERLRAAADRHGLRCTSLHVGLVGRDADPGLDGNPERIASIAGTLGIANIVVPMFDVPARLGGPRDGEGFIAWMSRVAPGLTRADWESLAARLGEHGRRLAARGLRLAYHNHNPEFAPLPASAGDGRDTGLDILLRGTDPALVSFELDVGWAAAAGVDPAALLRAHPGRFRLMHVKDVRATTRPNHAFAQDPADVGSGVVDWPALLPAAWAAGTRHFFIEQEPPFTRDRFAAVADGARYLAALPTTN